jgi:hypothetical protein
VGRLAAVLLLLLACEHEEARPAGDAGTSCRFLFGDAPVYRDCGGDADSCAFHTSGAYRTCEEVCDQLGAPCAAAYRTHDGCDLASPDLGCQHPDNEHICVCLRP